MCLAIPVIAADGGARCQALGPDVVIRWTTLPRARVLEDTERRDVTANGMNAWISAIEDFEVDNLANRLTQI